jgi:hypothetical protein
MTNKKTQKIGIITYNCIGNGHYDNGWMNKNGKKYLIVQNNHKSEWAANSGSSKTNKKIRADSVEYLLEGSMETLKQLDHVFLYVGSYGAEVAIKLTKAIPAEKLTYVMCSCNSRVKSNLIKKYGHADSEVIGCECGGHYTLEKLLKAK